jgi:hypothetical protein
MNFISIHLTFKKMKKMKITFGIFFMLFFCSWTVQAQNESGSNSNVIEKNVWYTESFTIECPTTGPIDLTVKSHGVVKWFNDGSGTMNWNTIGEGIDSNGGKWIFHEKYGMKYNPFSQGIRLVHLIGPNGVKLTMKVIIVVNGIDEQIHYYWEPLCD